MRWVTWVIDFVVWNLVPSGVICAGRSPTPQEYSGWTGFGRLVVTGRCAVCKEEYWTWRKRSICGSFKCYRQQRVWDREMEAK